MIDAHGDALVADFQRFYGLRLSDVVTGSHSPRTALALVEQLPESSAFLAAARGGKEHIGWDTNAYLIAALIDSVNMTTWAVAAQNQKRKPPKPKPFERPGRKTRVTKARSLIENNPRAMPIPEHRLPKRA
ncbi:hypothetical protein [Streptomyces sp. NPDC002644]